MIENDVEHELLGYDLARNKAKTNILKLYYDCTVIMDAPNHDMGFGNALRIKDCLNRFFRDELDKTL